MEETFKYRKLDMLIISIQSHKKLLVQRMWYLPLLVLLWSVSSYSGYYTITLMLWLSRMFYKVPYGYLPLTGV
jgi:hypothetical protein